MIFDAKHEMIRKLVRQFAETELTTEVLDKVEATGEFPEEIVDKMAKCGFLGLKIPREYGGGGGGLFAAHVCAHVAHGLCGLLMRGLQRLGALALGRTLGLCQQRIRCGGLPALRIAARLCGRIELLLGGAPGADPVLNARIACGHERHQRVKQQLLQNHQQHEKADHRPDEFGDVDAQSVCLPYPVLLSRSYRSAKTRSAGHKSSAIRADPWR